MGWLPFLSDTNVDYRHRKGFRQSSSPLERNVVPEDDGRKSGPAVISDDFASRVTSIAALAEPVRCAKFHLDKLVDDELLEFEFRRPPGRRGPGAGRPSKVYRRSAREVAVSLPERHYELAGRLLAEAVTRSQLEGESVAGGLRNAARATGCSLAERILEQTGHKAGQTKLLKAVIAELEGQGYEPRREPDGIIMGNCPFHSLAAEYTDLVCGMNLDIMHGLLDCLEGSGLEAKLDPVEGQCCVRLQEQ
jgi:predicted ArsR family transcriptional regulator